MASELMTATVRLTKAVSVVAAALLMLPINAQAENSYFYDKLIAESKIDARYAPTVGVVCSPLSRTLTYDVYFSNPAWKDYIITYRGTTAQSCTPHDAKHTWMFIPAINRQSATLDTPEGLPASLLKDILEESRILSADGNAVAKAKLFFEAYLKTDPALIRLYEWNAGARCNIQSERLELMNFTTRKMYKITETCDTQRPEMISVLKHTDAYPKYNVMAPSFNSLKSFLLDTNNVNISFVQQY